MPLTLREYVLGRVAEGRMPYEMAADWLTREPGDRLVCVPCRDRRLKAQMKGGEQMSKVVKVSDRFYEQIKAMASQDDKPIAEVVDEIAGGAVGTRAEFEELRKACAEELGISVAADPAWEERMLQLIPVGMSNKLDNIREVYACALDKLLPESQVEQAEELGEVDEGVHLEEGEEE